MRDNSSSGKVCRGLRVEIYRRKKRKDWEKASTKGNEKTTNPGTCRKVWAFLLFVSTDPLQHQPLSSATSAVE